MLRLTTLSLLSGFAAIAFAGQPLQAVSDCPPPAAPMMVLQAPVVPAPAFSVPAQQFAPVVQRSTVRQMVPVDVTTETTTTAVMQPFAVQASPGGSQGSSIPMATVATPQAAPPSGGSLGSEPSRGLFRRGGERLGWLRGFRDRRLDSVDRRSTRRDRFASN